MKDFYLHDRALAAYLEKDWFDHILASHPRKPSFEFAPFATENLYSNYHENLVEFLTKALAVNELRPAALLEIGASLGRSFFEVCKKIKSVKSATLVEPSLNLFTMCEKILTGADDVELLILKGNSDFDRVRLKTTAIKQICADVQLTRKQTPFQKLKPELHDLVFCANVIDQCRDHLHLADFLKASTAPGGVLLLSCTYQWNAKYIGNAPPALNDIHELFNADWGLLGETNLPFQVRVNERQWLKFLSHVVVYRNLSGQ